MAELLAGYPHLQEAVLQETSESAVVMGKYLWALKKELETGGL